MTVRSSIVLSWVRYLAERQMVKWLDQKSHMTSYSWRSEYTARSSMAWSSSPNRICSSVLRTSSFSALEALSVV